MRYHEKMDYKSAILYASLVTEFGLRSKQALKGLFGDSESSELLNFRIRTKECTELIVTAFNEYLLVVVQNCSGKPWTWKTESLSPEVQ